LGATAGAGMEAMVGDVSKLGEALVGDVDSALLFASPGEALKLRLLAGPGFVTPVIGTSALAAKTIVAVAAEHVAVGYEGPPEISTSNVATAHFDTSPQPVSSPGSPNTVAAPLLNAYQQNLLLLKVKQKATWQVLIAGAVTMLSSVTW